MVQVLAEVWPDRESLTTALNHAAEERRVDLVWLLLDNSADLKFVDLHGIADCNDKELLLFFFDRWAQVDSENGLTEIVLAMPRPLTGLIREYASAQLPDSARQSPEILHPAGSSKVDWAHAMDGWKPPITGTRRLLPE